MTTVGRAVEIRCASGNGSGIARDGGDDREREDCRDVLSGGKVIESLSELELCLGRSRYRCLSIT